MQWDIIFGNGLRAAIGPEAAVYALLAVGRNLHWGYTGLLNLGQAGFMLVGAYGLAVIVAAVCWSMWIGVLVLLCTGLVALLVASPWGRVIRSIREDEDAARSLGKNVVAIKMQALVVGGGHRGRPGPAFPERG